MRRIFTLALVTKTLLFAGVVVGFVLQAGVGPGIQILNTVNGVGPGIQ